MKIPDSITWYLKWKMHTFRHDIFSSFRSPKTYIAMSLGLMMAAFINNDRQMMLAASILFGFYWIYADYSRGVPRSWKNRQIIEKHNRKSQTKKEISSGSETQ